MDALASLVDAVPLLIVTVLGGWLLNGRLNRLEAKIDARPTRDEMNSRFERIEAETTALRSDMTQIALAVGARSRPETG